MTGLKAAVMLDYVLVSKRVGGDTLGVVAQLLAASSRVRGVTVAHAVQLGDCVFMLRAEALQRRTDRPLFVSLAGSTPSKVAPPAAEQLAAACGMCTCLCTALVRMLQPAVNDTCTCCASVYRFQRAW